MSKKKAVEKSDKDIADQKAVAAREGFELKIPDWITVSKAVNGYTLDTNLDGTQVWIASDTKQLAELLERLFNGVPAKTEQPEIEIIKD